MMSSDRIGVRDYYRTINAWLLVQAAVLDAHQSYVKGIAWDPIGTYLASQSDDKSIIVWRCSDWTAIHRITSPFEQVSLYA